MIAETRVSVYGVIVRQGKILLCRLSKIVPNAEGKWTLPGGGIEFGEALQDALIREIREETGLEAQFQSWLTANDDTFQHPERTVQAIRLIAIASVQDGEISHELDGSTDLADWIDLEKVDELPLVETARFALNAYIKTKNAPESGASQV